MKPKITTLTCRLCLVSGTLLSRLVLISVISLVLLNTISAQKLWYVDRDANGSDNGTSWTNAWKSLNNVNWTSVGSGDSIYVSGGTDSTLYKDYAGGGTGILIFPSSYGLDGRVFTQEVVIAPAWQSGHNGRVYFVPRDNDVQWLVEIHAISNIKLTGFTFIDTRTNNVGTMFYLGGAGVNDLHYRDSLITIENCYIEGRGNLIYLSGYKITIKDCYIHVIDHNYNIEQDPIGISNGLGGHSIIGNTIVSDYASETTANHEDGIQISNIGWEGMTDYTRRTVTIANNLLIFTSPYGVSWNNLIYNYGWDYTPSVRYLIYNNIMVARKIHTALGGIAIGRLTGDHPNSLYLLNNTIILKNNGTGNPIVNWDLDTMVVKNNLIIVDTTIANFYNLATGYNRYDIDYNHYAEYDGQDNDELFATRSSTYTWAEWKSAGYDNHSTVSTSGAVAFANKYGLNKADYYTATGRDAGVDLSSTYPFLATDILGHPRSGSWDLGALEYQDGNSSIDNTPPSLLGAIIINPTTIELSFSERLDNTSALTKANYIINNGITVNSVSLSTDGKKVNLITTTNAPNQTYTVTVVNVKDAAGNIISSNNSAQYSYAGDSTPPALISAAVLSPTSIELLFSEELETSSAQTKSNYSINNGISVNSASLSTDRKKVTFTTSQHIVSQNYTVTVSNVRDLAGNVISTTSTQYSFVNSTVGNLKANIKIFLQGAFQNGSLTTALYDNELLPSAQPYSFVPWSYKGNEILVTGSVSAVVDWILIELRSAQNPTQVISRRAALLRSDGRIMEPNGSLGITFSNVLFGSYYIAVFHRNHLSVMTSAAVSFFPDNTLYDFTTSQSKAYGQNAMAELSSGVFGMFSGDGNSNGIVDDKDRSDVWSIQNGNLGYMNGDFNLDSGVTVKDINNYWNNNIGKSTQVP